MNRGALIASAALHGGVAALALLSWPEAAEAPRPPPVPVTLVSAGAAQGSPADVFAPEAVAPEFAPEPAPDAPAPQAAPPQPEIAPVPSPTPPPPSPPTPAPQPAPSRTTPLNPAPTQAPRPAPQRPQPTRPAPPRPTQESLDLNALSSRLAKASPASGGSRRGAPKQAAQAAGPTPAQLQAAGQQLGARLQELWNPNCRVEGGDRINVRLRFRLQNGRVAGRPEVDGGPSSDPLVRAAEERAIRAVYSAAPYDWLPEVMQNGDYAPLFNAEAACG